MLNTDTPCRTGSWGRLAGGGDAVSGNVGSRATFVRCLTDGRIEIPPSARTVYYTEQGDMLPGSVLFVPLLLFSFSKK